MKAKKLLLGAVTLLAATTLAACSNGGTDKDIVTMKGSTITVSEFYEQVKSNPQAQQVLVNMVVADVFEKQYGDKITDAEVEKDFKEMKEQYGTQFSAALTSAGLTEKTYKDQIRANKLVEYATAQAAEKELTDKSYEEAFKSYTPEVTAQVIQLSDESKAKDVLKKAQKDGADFKKLAKENSEDTATKDKGGEIKFDSTSTTVPAEVQKAAFALKEGQVSSQVVSVVNYQTYSSTYYIVKLTKKTSKSKNWKDYKDVLKKSIVDSKKNDSTFVSKIVSDALSKANVKVKDAAFQNIISQYANTSAVSSTSSSSTANSSGSTKSSSDSK